MDMSIGAVHHVLEELATKPNDLRCVRIRLSRKDIPLLLSATVDGWKTKSFFNAVDSLLSQGVHFERKTAVQVSQCKGDLQRFDGRRSTVDRNTDMCKDLFPRLWNLGTLTHAPKGLGVFPDLS